FANIVLADEINRTSPKVQASMLEAMAEKQVTVDNVTHPLEDIFLVLATQNPLDQAGTYPLPKAQLDRFLFKIRMTFLPREAELDVLRMKYPQCRGDEPADASPIVAAPVITPTGLVQTRQTIASHVRIDRSIQETLVDVACGLRDDKRVHQGISTRSLVVAIPALQAHAFINGRDFVTPDDIKALAFPIFGHRLELKHGLTNSDEVIETVMAPIVDRVSSQSVRLWDKAK
ncbi:MAG: MoxR family ATPase, partial [Planctomycetota bacterium]